MPQPAGYCGKPLWQKIGLASGQRLLLVAIDATWSGLKLLRRRA